MRFIEALALVVSKRRRVEHGAWDSWAQETIQRHREENTSGVVAREGSEVIVSVRENATARRHREEIAGAYSAEGAPSDLNAAFAEFIAKGEGRL